MSKLYRGYTGLISDMRRFRSSSVQKLIRVEGFGSPTLRKPQEAEIYAKGASPGFEVGLVEDIVAIARGSRTQV